MAIPLLAMAAAPAPSGRTIAEQGNGHGAPACGACHGSGYQGNPAIQAPAIRGLPAPFIIARLEHYASPQGHNASMRQVATALTPAERQAVAAYLASRPKTPHS